MISIELLTAARKGDPKAAQRAAAALLPEALKITLRLARRGGVPRDEAEAAVPEICWLAIQRWDPERGAIGAAIFFQARSAIRDLRRLLHPSGMQFGGLHGDEDVAHSGNLLGELFDGDLPLERLVAAKQDYESLPPACRDALFDVSEGLSAEESASRAGRSVYAIRALRIRARRHLRETKARECLVALAAGWDVLEQAQALFQSVAAKELQRRARQAGIDVEQAVEQAPAVCRRALGTWPRSGSFRHWLVNEVLVALRALAQPGARERRRRSDARVLEAVAKGEPTEIAVRKFSPTAAAELRRLKVEDAAERAPEVCRRALAAFDHRGSFRLWLKAEARRSLQPGYMDRAERTA